MSSAIEVAQYIRAKQSLLGEVQMQKLTYYAQAWSLAWDGRPLFEEPIEAWRMGPVVPALRRTWPAPDDSVLTPRERATVDAVIEFYGQHHGAALATMTHAELPWAQVWEQRPAGSERCSDEIPHESMRRFYTRLSLTSQEIPQRAPVQEDASADDALRLAAGNADRWRETLAILAQ